LSIAVYVTVVVPSAETVSKVESPGVVVESMGCAPDAEYVMLFIPDPPASSVATIFTATSELFHPPPPDEGDG
jgi:hypothetical protein